jgi:hypothetical protein
VRIRSRAIKRVFLGIVVTAAAAAPDADAGQYRVYSCKTPAGAVAPTDGWVAEQAGVAFSVAQNSCAGGGALAAQVSGDFAQPAGSYVRWHWTAAPNTQLRGLNVWRSASATAASEVNATPATHISWPSSAVSDARDNCVPGWGCTSLGSHSTWNAAGNFLSYGADVVNGSTDVFATAACGGTSGWSCADRNSATPMADLRVHAMEATLEDATDPVPAGAGGTLTRSGAHKGVQSITFNATDTGAGIYRGIVEIKRAGEASFSPIYSQVIDSNGGKCADAGATAVSIYEFLYRVPCKLSTGAQVDFDTTTVVDGIHEVRVKVEDAAGNQATVFGPAAFEVDNVPPPAPVDPDGAGPLSGQPSILGATKVGNTLVGDKGSWSGNGNGFQTEWLRCVNAQDLGGCTVVDGVNGPELELRTADLGYHMRFRVTATNAEGTTTVASAAKGPVTRADGTLPDCADGVDNDGDGKVDGADGGCTDNGDGTEQTDGAQCGNGIDDDGDGKVDAADGECSGATDDSEGGSGSGGDHGSGGIISPGPATGTQSSALGTPNNGANASNRALITLTGTRKRSVRFGRRIATVVTLRDENGRPIAGARVSVLERMSTPGSNWVPAREPLVTDNDGKMRWLIPAKFSRTIRYAYKANLQNTDFQSTADVQLTVSSKTTLKPNKRFFRNGQTIRFSGRLLSKPVPRGGVLIDLQAKVGSRWQTFKTTRTRRNGKWLTSYTFRATRGLQTYTFRARVRQDTGFPYSISKSKQLRVKVAG